MNLNELKDSAGSNTVPDMKTSDSEFNDEVKEDSWKTMKEYKFY